MSTTEKELRIKYSADTTSYEAGINRNVRANEKLLESENKVKKNLGGLVKDFASAGSAGDALAMGMERLSETFKVGLAASVGVGIGLALKKGIEDTAAAMDKLSKAAEDVFSMDERDSVKTMQELRTEAEKAGDAIKQYQEAITELQTTWGSIKYNATSTELEGSAGQIARLQTTLDNLRAVEQRRIEGMVAKEQERVELTRLVARGETEKAEEMERQLRYAREVADAEKTGSAQLVAAVKDRHEAEEEGRERAQEARNAEIAAQWRIMAAQRQQDDSAIRQAEAKLELAKQQLAVELDPERKRDRELAVYSAQTQVMEARRRAVEEKQNIELAKESANRGGEESAKRMHLLEKERELIELRMRSAKPDERGRMEVALAEKNAQIEDERKRQAESRLARESTALGRNAGFGPTAELDLAKSRLEITKKQIELELSAKNFSDERLDNLRDSYFEQERSIKLKQAELAVESAQYNAQKEILNIEGSTQGEATKRYNVTLAQLKAVNAEIAAMGSLNSELAKAAQLRKQGLQNDLQAQDEALNFGKSQRDIRARLREEDRNKRKLEQFRRQREESGGLIDVKRNLAGEVTEGRNPVTGEKVEREPSDQMSPDKFQRGKIDTKPRLKEQMEKDTKSFRDRFAKKTGEDAADKAADKAKEAKDDAKPKAGETPEVKELQKLNQKIDKLMLQ